MGIGLPNKNNRKKWMKFFTHLLVMVILFILPEIMLGYTRPHWRSPASSFCLYAKAAIYVAVFYINFFLILNSTLLSNKPNRFWKFLGWNLLVVIAALALTYLVQTLCLPAPPEAQPAMGRPRMPHPGSHNRLWLHALSYMLRDAGMLVLTIALAVALKMGGKWTEMEKQHEQLLNTQKTEELQSLKNQINPHFLFNTLNTIYALIAMSPEKAQQAVHQLSTLLRYVLYENPSTVRLSQEVDFMRSYISLMQMRMGRNPINAKFNIPENADAEVAPLMFITLIENAFKHGNTGNPLHPIDIELTLTDDGNIECATSNHFTETLKPTTQGGIGLANLRRRLQLLYGDRAVLATNIDGDRYLAKLTVKSFNPKAI